MEQISSICGTLCALCIVALPIVLITWVVMLIIKSKKKNVAKYALLSLIAGIILFTAIGVATDPATGCEHEWEIVKAVNATCTEQGENLKKCLHCGTEEKELTPIAEHITTEEIIREATCSSEGLFQKTCSACGAVENNIIEKTEHTYKKIVVEATLETDGTENLTCTVCGETHQKKIEKLGTKENPGKVTVSGLAAEIKSDIAAAGKKYDGKWIEITGKVKSVHDVGGMSAYYLYGVRGKEGLRIVCWCDGSVMNASEVVGKTLTFLGQMREVTTFNTTDIGDCQIISQG